MPIALQLNKYNDLFEVLALLTLRCNCACTFCCEKGLEKNDTIEEFISYIGILKSLGVKVFDINGGEPLLRRLEIPIILDRVVEAGLQPSISSNLTLLKEEDVAIFKKYNVLVNCSLHGKNSKTNDGLMGKIGAYDSIIKNIKLLTDNDIEVHVTSVVVKENFEEMESIAKWCYESKVRTFCMNVVFGRGNGKNVLSKDRQPNRREVISLRDKIRQQYDLSKFNIYVNESRIGQCILLRPGGGLFGAPSNPRTSEDGLINIGNIKDRDIIEKWKQYQYKDSHFFYNTEKFSPYIVKDKKHFNSVVYYALPDIVSELDKYIKFIGLVGSFASNDQTIVDGKYRSDVDYYIVLNKHFKKNSLEIIKKIKFIKKKYSYLPLSFWLVEFEEFYGDDKKDTLSPVHLFESKAILYEK